MILLNIILIIFVSLIISFAITYLVPMFFCGNIDEEYYNEYSKEETDQDEIEEIIMYGILEDGENNEEEL